VLAYLVEVLGGVIVCCLALLRIPTFLYAGILIWYGIVIPSCYLINSTDNKTSIIEEGWINAISKLYKKKDPRDKRKDPSARQTINQPAKPKDSENCRNDITLRGPQADATQEEESNRSASRPKPRPIRSRQAKISKECKKESFHTAKFQFRIGAILQDLEDIS
jgi:hypothetical protein